MFDPLKSRRVRPHGLCSYHLVFCSKVRAFRFKHNYAVLCYLVILNVSHTHRKRKPRYLYHIRVVITTVIAVFGTCARLLPAGFLYETSVPIRILAYYFAAHYIMFWSYKVIHGGLRPINMYIIPVCLWKFYGRFIAAVRRDVEEWKKILYRQRMFRAIPAKSFSDSRTSETKRTLTSCLK